MISETCLLEEGFCNADNSKDLRSIPAFLRAGSNYMSWTMRIACHDECAEVYSYRKLFLLLEFGQFLVDFLIADC